MVPRAGTALSSTEGSRELLQCLPLQQAENFQGVISINDVDNKVGRAHLDYWIAVPYQRRGRAIKAAALAMDYARTELKLRALLSSCLATNAVSARVLERNGFSSTVGRRAPRESLQGRKYAGFAASSSLALSGSEQAIGYSRIATAASAVVISSGFWPSISNRRHI
jgi:hypothetical protein